MPTENDAPPVARPVDVDAPDVRGDPSARLLDGVGSAHPLGPLIESVPMRGAFSRGYALLMLAGCVTLLGVAAYLEPSPDGLGTHTGLGLPRCSMVMLVGYPCPTCGMTTAFAHGVRGRFLAAFHAQPVGLGLFLVTVAVGVVAMVALFTGRVWTINWYRLPPGRLTVVIALLLIGGWAYKLVFGVMSGAYPIGR